MKKILLTGRTGFVGRWFDKINLSYDLSDLNGVNLTNKKAVNDILTNHRTDYVIHLAAQSFVPDSFKNPLETFQVNFYGTLNLLQSLKSSGFKGRFLYVSSSDVYGLADDLPVTECHSVKPRNPYAVSKVAAEALCYQWSQTEDFDVIIARPFNHIGPGQSERFVISDFAKQIMEIKRGQREPVLYVGHIDVTRDFTDVRDVIQAYYLLLEHGQNSEIYNICSGSEVSISYMLNRLLELANVKADVVIDKSRLRKAEQLRVYGDHSKLKLATKWQPKITLDQTLIELLNDWKKIND